MHRLWLEVSLLCLVYMFMFDIQNHNHRLIFLQSLYNKRHMYHVVTQNIICIHKIFSYILYGPLKIKSLHYHPILLILFKGVAKCLNGGHDHK